MGEAYNFRKSFERNSQKTGIIMTSGMLLQKYLESYIITEKYYKIKIFIHKFMCVKTCSTERKQYSFLFNPTDDKMHANRRIPFLFSLSIKSNIFTCSKIEKSFILLNFTSDPKIDC